MSNSKVAKARAEASFKRKEEQARQATKAWIEYEAQRRAVAERTERLRQHRPIRDHLPAGRGFR